MWKILSICLIATLIYANDTIHLVVPEFPPYTYLEGDQIKGIGVEKIKKIFSTINIPISIRHVPNYGRAVLEVREGNADGFFLASQNSERDSIAQFSAPVVMNNWCWFSHRNGSTDFHSSQFKKTAKVATPLNSNTHKWLKAHEYKVIFPVNNTDLYVKLLNRKKVDAIFIAEEVFLLQLQEEKIPPKRYNKKIEVSKEFGIYISHSIMTRQPHLMKTINAAIRKVNNAGEVQ